MKEPRQLCEHPREQTRLGNGHWGREAAGEGIARRAVCPWAHLSLCLRQSSCWLRLRAATPNTPWGPSSLLLLVQGEEQAPGPLSPPCCRGSHPPHSLSWNCFPNCRMSSKDSTRKTCSSSGGEAMARSEVMSARWMPTA